MIASERLLGQAEREPDIDPGWLDELCEEHDELVRAAARSERHVAGSAIFA